MATQTAFDVPHALPLTSASGAQLRSLRPAVAARCASAIESAIRRMPATDALDTEGLDLPAERLAQLLAVDLDAWREEVGLIEEHYARFGDRPPDTLDAKLQALEKRLADGPQVS